MYQRYSPILGDYPILEHTKLSLMSVKFSFGMRLSKLVVDKVKLGFYMVKYYISSYHMVSNKVMLHINVLYPIVIHRVLSQIDGAHVNTQH